MKSSRRRGLAASLLAVFVVWVAGPALADAVPANLGLLVMLKVLTYDSSFDKRGGDGEFLVLVPFSYPQSASANDLVAAGGELTTRSIQGRRLHFEPMPAAELEAQLVARRPAALLIPADTPVDQARVFAAAAERHKLYTMSLGEGLVKAGLTVGVALNNGKPQVIINATVAKNIGADFNNAVMRVARVYQ